MVRGPWRAALIGAMVAALATLPGLGVGTLWDNSETAYGEVAREVLLFGDPVVLHFNGAPWFVQPPLYFWIAAAFSKAFGVSAFALRLPSALATIGMAGAVGLAVARVRGPRTAVLAAIVLSTSLMQAVLGRLAIMDALLDLAVTIAVLSWFAAVRTGGSTWFYIGWVALAFGTLAKGPVALVIALLIVVPWCYWERSAGGIVRFPSVRRWTVGIALFAGLILPYALLLYRAAGGAAFAQLLGHYTVGRYLGTIENQSGPLWYYFPVLIVGTFPWFAYLAPALLHGRAESRSSGEAGAFARLAVAWAVVPFLFFSLAQTKLPNYIALELPALAILVACWFEGAAERVERRAALAWTAIVPVTIGLMAFAIYVFSSDNKLTRDLPSARGVLAGEGALIFLGSVLCFVLLVRRGTAWLGPFALGAASLAAMLSLATIAEPLAEPFKPIPQLAAVIERERRPGDTVSIFGVSGGNALLFYTHPHVDTPENARTAICGAPRAFVVTSKRHASDGTYGRRRRLVAQADNDVLYLFDGPVCGT